MSLGFGTVFDYMAGIIDWLAFGLPTEGREADRPRAGDVARRDVPTCSLTGLVRDAMAKMRAAGWDSCLVTNESGIVLGRVRPGDLEDASGDVTVETVMEAGPTSVRQSEYLDALVGRMQKQEAEDIIVTSSAGGLVGVLRLTEAENHLAEHDRS